MATTKTDLLTQIENLGDLKKALSLWCDRDDDEFNNARHNFINFAEKDIYRRLKIPSLEREVYLNVVDGIAFIPPDMIQMKYLFNRNTIETYRVTGLEEVQAIRRGEYNNPAKDVCFARINNRLIFSEPIDAPSTDGKTDGSIIMGYISDIPELIKDTDSCAILTIAPDLMLYMAMKHACIFVQDDDGAQKYGMLAEAALAVIQEQANKAEFSGSPLVKPDTIYTNNQNCYNDYSYGVLRH